ncbi:stage II sporulation protein D [Desulfitobacterium metallireducens]|uniref:Stage II sporulation protein D n=1 Tax=Desulfitobacterium metallireducens DSM 15288 TaxID=871968 RepID=W0EBN4_9FIRM|nr:stage II sporulation protein D [Desulfitobacterium metallireducens]AHF08265.1 stage II sporulation protein D [Desulfitobacterium metallireducens DSM 15288]
MKKEGITILVLSLIIIFLIPWSIMRWQKEEIPLGDFNIRVKMPGGNVETLALEEYLVGVVAAEMPAEFDSEALKAQAVAARTYAAKQISRRSDSDQGYDVDTTVQTQAWLTDTQMKVKWGWWGYWRYHKPVLDSVESTKGQVLVANGQYIDAFYHSSSGRKPTERAEEVWSSSRLYLQNVESGETNQTRFVKTYTYTPNVLYQKLGISQTPQNFKASDFAIISQTTAGRAKEVRVLGKVFTAPQLRTLLGLASTDIEFTIQPEEIQLKTYGNGHAVGMSQYGANDLGKAGSTYSEILSHFYPGTQILALSKGNQNP